jgi:hypothetical protein
MIFRNITDAIFGVSDRLRIKNNCQQYHDNCNQYKFSDHWLYQIVFWLISQYPLRTNIPGIRHTITFWYNSHHMPMECIRCGNCCPDTCSSKKRNGDNTVTCEIHPSITGKDDRGLFCSMETFFWYKHGIACRAFFSPGLYPGLQTETLSNGQVVRILPSANIPA